LDTRELNIAFLHTERSKGAVKVASKGAVNVADLMVATLDSSVDWLSLSGGIAFVSPV
jgi:hypothetical protein